MKKNKYYKISEIIVNNRKIFVVLFLILSIASIYTMDLVNIQDDLLSYLDDDSLTKTGVEVMDKEFDNPNITANVMLEEISLEDAELIYEDILNQDGILSVVFNSTETNYKDEKALYNITFESNQAEDALKVMETIKDELQDYEISINSTLYQGDIEGLNNDMVVILVIVVILILLIVTLTSKSFGEIPVLLIVFAVAAIVNMGTNFLFGEISFISNAVAVILQLALAIDYALILIHRYTEEREKLNSEKSCKLALSKAIPEILSSSLTTIFSLVALSFMTYSIGADLSKVLIKSILISLLAVFTLMPALIMLFDKLIEKTRHKNYIPNIEKISKVSIKSRYVVLPLFIIITILAGILSYETNYEFYEGGASEEYKNQILNIENTFGMSNSIIVLVPNDDIESELRYTKELNYLDNIESVLSYNTLEIYENITIQTELTYSKAAVLLNIDEEIVYNIYAAYASALEDTFSSEYSISVYNLVYFLYSNIENEHMSLGDKEVTIITYYFNQIESLENTFESENYSRIILNVNLPIEGEETYFLIEDIQDITNNYYEENYLVGNSVNSYELSNAFKIDNKIISIISILLITIILLFTFKSIYIAVSMIVVIQSAIFINFAFPYIFGVGLYFIGYLIVSAIQMGANIDYAIVITNRYKTLCEEMNYKDAITVALNEAFPTIITSGSILTIAGLVLYNVSSNTIIKTLGLCIGRGTFISIILVLIVLPQILYILSQLNDKKSKKNIKSIKLNNLAKKKKRILQQKKKKKRKVVKTSKRKRK
ncbi:MAG: MMPL family transporter [bacterium]